MRNQLKKVAATLVSVGVLTLPMVASADSSKEVNVNATINTTPSTFVLNFDAITFTGNVGDQLGGETVLQGQTVEDSSYTITTAYNYQVYVSGTDFASVDGKTLTANRISVNQYAYYLGPKDFAGQEASARVGTVLEPTELFNGSNVKGESHYVTFNLDLTTADNLYNDNAVLTNITDSTSFTSQVTFTYTGL